MAEAALRPREGLELPALHLDAARLAAAALAEDGPADVTTELLGPATLPAAGVIEYRDGGVVAGLAYAGAVALEAGASVTWEVEEGGAVGRAAAIGRVRGSLASVLRAERPLLNMLQRASAIATRTRAFVRALEGTGCRVLHTRKTAPGLRAFDIRAVLAGGGGLHRASLGSAVLFKDNHWRALRSVGGDLAAALWAARERGLPCYVEVESREQVELACRAGANRLLVDNQPPEIVRDWAALARRLAPGIEVEASGGITLENARAFAEAGADYVSVGALTHSVSARDFALAVDTVGG